MSSSSSSSKEKSIQDSRRAERAPNHSPSNRKSQKQRRFVGIAPATAARKLPSQNEARAARFSQKPSQRLNPKTIDPARGLIRTDKWAISFFVDGWDAWGRGLRYKGDFLVHMFIVVQQEKESENHVFCNLFERGNTVSVS